MGGPRPARRWRGWALATTLVLAVPTPVLLTAASASAEAGHAPIPSGSLAISGPLRNGSTLRVSGVTWTPAPCSAATGCSKVLTVSYAWQECAATCRPVRPAAVESLVPSYRLGPAEVGRRIKVTETAIDVRSDGNTERARVTATTSGTVGPWPAGTAPRVALLDGTPEATTASDEEQFVLSPPYANPADGPVSVRCSLDGAPPSGRCQQTARFTTPLLPPGRHTLRIEVKNAAGSTTTTFRWRVVPLPAPTPCPTCFHPPAVAADGQPLTWDWQLSDANRSLVLRHVDMIDIDGFDNSSATVARIHARQGLTLPSEKVICYLDLGAFEDYRPDASSFPKSTIGRGLAGWPGEYWVDIRQLAALRPVIDARLEMCADKGFDGVEVDDIDGYTQAAQTGFPLTAGDAQNWLSYVANEAHSLGLFVLWKNDPYLAGWATSYFDGALSEQCYQYAECTPQQNAGANGCNLSTHPCGVSLFEAAGKWVGEVEYADVCAPDRSCQGRRSFARFCQTVWSEPPRGLGFAAFKAELDLDGRGWYPCWSP